jgi:hypothetical protein
MRAPIVSAILLLSCWIAPPAYAQIGWGFESGRGGDTSASLIADVAFILRAEQRLNNVSRRRLGEEREEQFRGNETDGGASIIADAVHEWRTSVRGAVLRVAANPAASCDLVLDMARRVVSRERQAEIIGLVPDTAGSFEGDVAIIMRAVSQHCLGEAFDECMLTGNPAVFRSLIGGWRRQIQMLGVDSDLDERIVYLFRRCAVYKLIYHLDTRSRFFPARSVVDGSTTLFYIPKSDEGADVLTQLRDGEWRGPSEAEARAPDMQITSIECGQEIPICASTGTMPTASVAFGRIEFVRTYWVQGTEGAPGDGRALSSEQEFDASRLQIRSGERQTSGETRLQLKFIPAPIIVRTEVPNRRGPPVVNMLDGASAAMFMVVYGGGAQTPPDNHAGVRITNWDEDVYPILRTAEMSSDSVVVASNESRFQLVHRPDLFPEDQRVPAWEDFTVDLGPPSEPETESAPTE